MKKLLLPIAAGVMSLSASAQSAGYTYWFDESAQPQHVGTITAGTAELELDASALDGGVHFLHIQVRDADGKYSTIRSAAFIKPLDLSSARAYIYVDGELYTDVSVSGGAGPLNFEIDGAAFSRGLHTIATQVFSPDGTASAMTETVFMRVPTATELRGMRCYYTIDNDDSMRVEGRFGSNSLMADIDVTALSDGLHSINFMLASADGLTTKMYQAWFMKLPLGGVGVRSYEYWLNDNLDTRTKINVADAPNPFSLAALIPLPSQELRSKSFHFAVEEDTPVIYASNDFNIIFTDNRGYFKVQSTPYYDPAVRHEVTDIEEFDASYKNTGLMGENDIRWYRFDARAGDSLALRADRSCMLDLFAPDGTRLVSVSGADAVKGQGIHTPGTGAHYVAVHDPSTVGSSVGVRLSHIDKFAILDYYPKNMSNGDFVMFRLSGNGFENLKGAAIDSDVSPTNDLMTIFDWQSGTVTFRLDESPLAEGEHTLNMMFEEENGDMKIISRRFVVEAPTDEPIEVKVNTRNNTLTDPRRISVTVCNRSNVPLWGVPLCVARTSTEPDMQFGFDFMYDANVDMPDSVYYETDDLLGMGVKGRYTEVIIPYIGPNESLVYDFIIERIIWNDFDFYAWCGKPWSQEIADSEPQRSRPMKASSTHSDFNYTAYHQLNQAMDIAGHLPGAAGRPFGTAGNAMTFADRYAGHILATGQSIRQAEREIYPTLDPEDLPQYPFPSGMNPPGVTPQAMGTGGHNPGGGCPPGGNPFTNNGNNNCRNPNPRPSGHRVSFPSSLDPNDIIGYLSPAGSEYIGKDVRTLSYMIEFENDSVFATASALKVVVESTFDPGVFDTSTFRPTSLQLGKQTVAFSGDEQNFVTTVDMRPAISCIAQATVAFDQGKGKLTLTIESLSPYTMEVTDDLMQGFLPVNINGSGIGEFCFDIALKDGLADGKAIDAKATIVFDSNAAIDTPVWHNVTDYAAPVSEVSSAAVASDGSYDIIVDATDAGSGVWNYDLYMRDGGSLAWSLVRTNIDGPTYNYMPDGPLENPEFMTVARDYAGNEELNEITSGLRGDVDGSGKIDANDLVLLHSYYVGRPVNIRTSLADYNQDNKIDAQDMVGIRRVYVSSSAGKIRNRLKRTSR